MYIFSTLLFVKRNLALLPAMSEVHNYATRNKNKLISERCRYSATQKSFLYQGIKMFNVLPEGIKELPLTRFRQKLKNFLVATCLYDVTEFYEVVNSLS
ncbi:MAG: hypothetical protein KFE20_00440 [Candidatus Sulcia muelleri]|nr:hypothetical protein [Candidatus Karelsulcia muelleri]